MHQSNPLPDSPHWHPKNRNLALEREEGGGGAVLPSVLSKTHFDALTTNLERSVVRPHTHDLTYTFRRARSHTHQFGTAPLSGTGLLVTREREMRPVSERDAWKRGKRERDTSRETSAASWNRYRDRPRRKTRERSSSRTTERQKRRVIDRTRQTSDRESRLGILMKQRGGNDRGKERDNTGRKGGRERWQQEEYAPARVTGSTRCTLLWAYMRAHTATRRGQEDWLLINRRKYSRTPACEKQRDYHAGSMYIGEDLFSLLKMFFFRIAYQAI